MMSAYHPALFLITSLTCLGLTPSAQGRGLMSQPSTSVEAMARLQVRDDTGSEIPQPSNVNGDRFLLALHGEDLQISDKEEDWKRWSISSDRDRQVEIAIVDPVQIAQAQSESTTEEKTEEQKTSDSQKNKSTPKKGLSRKDLFWLFLLGLCTLGFAGIFAGSFYLLTRSGGEDETLQTEDSPEDGAPFPQPPEEIPKPEPEKYPERQDEIFSQAHQTNGYNETAIQVSEKNSPPTEITPPATESLSVSEPPRLAKIDAIEKAIEDLQSRIPSDRRKAIWELGQQGDSRAVQPLVNLLMDSDSKQRSLILAALAEIGNRTMQPMNRALVLSLQDPNPDVRKNAIRDLTRMYDLVSQSSQLLRHAVEDSDPEVREAAKWALAQLNRISSTSHSEPRSPLQNWSNSSENYPEEIP